MKRLPTDNEEHRRNQHSDGREGVISGILVMPRSGMGQPQEA